MQGAYAGYKSRKAANNAQDWQKNLNKRGVAENDPNRQGVNDNFRIKKNIDELYQNVGWFAQAWNQHGWSDMRRAFNYVQRLEKNLEQIKSALMSTGGDRYKQQEERFTNLSSDDF